MKIASIRTHLLIRGTLLLVLATGCKVGPNYVRPQVTAPPVYRGADDATVSSPNQNSVGDENWAQVFNEPELQDLIRTALEKNYDVRIAAQRVLEEQAQFRITRSQQFPTVTVGGTGIGADLGQHLGDVDLKLVRRRELAIVVARAAAMAEVGQVVEIAVEEGAARFHGRKDGAQAFAIAAGVADRHQAVCLGERAGLMHCWGVH